MKQEQNDPSFGYQSQRRLLAILCTGVLALVAIDSCGNPAAVTAVSAQSEAGENSAVSPTKPGAETPTRPSPVDTTVVEFWRYPDSSDVEIIRGQETGRVICSVRLPASLSLPGQDTRSRIDLLEPEIHRLLEALKPLTQPYHELWPERTTAILLTIPDANGKSVEILQRLTPKTRQWATQSVERLTLCLTRMQLLPPLTQPKPAILPVSRTASQSVSKAG
jgi:hypothetical protein